MDGKVLWILVILAIISSTNALALDAEMLNAHQATLEVSKSINKFSTIFYKAVSKDAPNNLIVSPLSAAIVLRMAAYGAEGKTGSEMRSALHFNTDDNRQKLGIQKLLSSMNSLKSVDLSVANKIFLAKGTELKPEYSDLTNTVFQSTTDTLDFVDTAAASSTINSWCENQTHSRIKDIVQPDDFNENTALVLVNAVYFKGNWLDKFDETETQLRDFHVDSQTTKKVSMMHKLGSYRYGLLPDIDAKFVEMPYKTSDDENPLSMIIILPNDIEGLETVEEGLQKMKLNQFFTGELHELDLFMPKFKIESTINLQNPLQDMGMIDMFTDSANFSGIVMDSRPLKVSKIVQKAFIEVNEEGSEAAAETALGLENRYGSIDDTMTPVKFAVDRPFFMFIANRNVMFFNGRYIYNELNLV